MGGVGVCYCLLGGREGMGWDMRAFFESSGVVV